MRSYSVQCSEDKTSAAQGSLRQGKLKYNSSSGKIGEFEKKRLNFRAKSGNLIKGEIYPGSLLLDPMVFPVYCCIIFVIREFNFMPV